MRIHAPLILLLLLLPCHAAARRVKKQFNAAPADTITLDMTAYPVVDKEQLLTVLHFSGYDKVREAGSESVFITNNGRNTILSVSFRIEYLTLDGKQLHERTVTRKCRIPAGETRKLDFPSWDKQKSFYYRLSRTPQRTSATPYDILISPLTIIVE